MIFEALTLTVGYCELNSWGGAIMAPRWPWSHVITNFVDLLDNGSVRYNYKIVYLGLLKNSLLLFGYIENDSNFCENQTFV